VRVCYQADGRGALLTTASNGIRGYQTASGLLFDFQSRLGKEREAIHPPQGSGGGGATAGSMGGERRPAFVWGAPGGRPAGFPLYGRFDALKERSWPGGDSGSRAIEGRSIWSPSAGDHGTDRGITLVSWLPCLAIAISYQLTIPGPCTWQYRPSRLFGPTDLEDHHGEISYIALNRREPCLAEMSDGPSMHERYQGDLVLERSGSLRKDSSRSGKRGLYGPGGTIARRRAISPRGPLIGNGESSVEPAWTRQ
jgi:hypothetical protein